MNSDVGRNAPQLLPRVLFSALVVAITFMGNEFPPDGESNFWFGDVVFGVPLQYPALAGLALVFLPTVFATPRFSVVARLKEMRMWAPIVAVWAALIIAIGYALVTGARELFADWRNIVVMAMLTTLVARWMKAQSWREAALVDLAIGYGLAGLVPLGRWLSGTGGTDIFGEVVPIFFYPPLFMTTYASLVCISTWMVGTKRLGVARAWLVRIVAITSSFLVLVSFRRSFWLAWVLAALALVVVLVRRAGLGRGRLLAVGLVAATLGGAAVATIGVDAVTGRLESFSLGSSNQYSATNTDHVNDILDALVVISASPVTGLGIGRSYASPSIALWKPSSFEVHNALVHTWLKFGIIGLVAYVWFHGAWIRLQMGISSSYSQAGAANAALGAYMLAIVINNLIQTSVYGSFQMSVHLGVLLGIGVACAPVRSDRRFDRRPQGLPVQ